MPWIMGKMFGVPRLVWALLAFLALVIAIVTLIGKEKDENVQIGVDLERGKAAEVVVKRVEKANEVRETFSADQRAVYDECLRSARTRENCERFLPVGQSD